MEFVCTLGSPEGDVVEEVHEASNEAAVRAELVRRGFHVFKIRRRGLGRLWAGRSGSEQGRIPPQQLLVFNQELATLLNAGLPVLQALHLMAERQKKPALKSVLVQVHEKVKGGADLSQAFEELGDVLPPIYAQTLKAGERSGELVGVLRRFIRFQKLVTDARRKVVTALVYPIVLIGLSLVLIVVMGVMVIPKFSDFYQTLEIKLPATTRIVLTVSTFLQDYWIVSALSLAAALVAVIQLSRLKRGGRLFDQWKTRFPLLGSIFRKMALSEFSRSLATLLGGGIPLVSALDSSVSAVSNRFIRARLEPVIEQVSQGSALFHALDKTGVVPEIVVEMTKVGEETGALDGMLNNASDFLDEEVDVTMQRALSLVEPLMLVLMGALLAFLLVAIYLPLFSALGQMQA